MQMLFNQMSASQMNQPAGTGNRPNNHNCHTCVTNRYCWTNGACEHNGSECRAPTTGHQAAAMFQDHMGGSTCNVRNTWRGGTGYNTIKVNKESSLLNPVVPPSIPTPSTSAWRQPRVTFASIVAKADSGTSRNYFRLQYATILNGLHTFQNGKPVHLPDG